MSDKPEHQEIAQLKQYIDDRVEQLREQQTTQYLDALKAAGLDREQIESKAEALMSHGMTRRAALGAMVGAAFLSGNVLAAPGDDGDTVWGSDPNRDDYYADEIDLNVLLDGAGVEHTGALVDGNWEIQKNGSDTSGVINFKT